MDISLLQEFRNTVMDAVVEAYNECQNLRPFLAYMTGDKRQILMDCEEVFQWVSDGTPQGIVLQIMVGGDPRDAPPEMRASLVSIYLRGKLLKEDALIYVVGVHCTERKSKLKAKKKRKQAVLLYSEARNGECLDAFLKVRNGKVKKQPWSPASVESFFVGLLNDDVEKGYL